MSNTTDQRDEQANVIVRHPSALVNTVPWPVRRAMRQIEQLTQTEEPDEG